MEANAQMAARQTAQPRPATGRKNGSSPDSRSPAAGACGRRQERKRKQGRARCFDQGQAGTPHRYPWRGDVNLDKYDERIDKLVDAKAERMESAARRSRS